MSDFVKLTEGGRKAKAFVLATVLGFVVVLLVVAKGAAGDAPAIFGSWVMFEGGIYAAFSGANGLEHWAKAKGAPVGKS